jgi:type I restriction-modification system DNA methylase subunit
VQGDLYEYLLSRLSTAGRNGQFRTPRHIIRMMVQMIEPHPNERIGDLLLAQQAFWSMPTSIFWKNIRPLKV